MNAIVARNERMSYNLRPQEYNIDEDLKMEWFKKHADTLAIIAIMFGGFLWADGKFEKINDRFASLEQDVAQIKTVLIIRGMMPESMAVND